jgi:hypothetical protein
MREFRNLAVICLVVLLSACATTRYPTKPEDQVTVDLKTAVDNVDKLNGSYSVYININAALSKPTGPDRVRSLLATNAAVANAYKTELTSTINGLMGANAAIRTKESLDTVAGAFPVGALQPMNDALERRVAAGNADGSLPFMLNDHYKIFASLRSPDQERHVVDNTISYLQGNDRSYRPVRELMAYASRVGPTSKEGLRIGEALVTMNIRRSELAEVASVYPEFAASYATKVAAKVLLRVEPPDRLFREDLIAVFRSNLKGVELVDTDGPQIVSVTVERLRYNEQKLPDRTETITYSWTDVNAVAAVLLMPRNASYLYEITTASAEIEFGFAVKATQNGKQIADDLLRDRITVASRSCENARIQNVFGGVQRADFVANDDMVRRCQSSGGTANIESLRNTVYVKIADQVAKLPPIARAQAFE